MQNRVETSEELKVVASETRKLREAKIILAIGEKGVGKTHETMRFFSEEYTQTSRYKKGRKVLIYDTNGEFENVDPLSLYDIPKFNIQQQIEIRRILARDPDTFRHLGVDGKYKLLEDILREELSPRGMALLLEDLNSYAVGVTSKSMVDVLTTNRHKDLDIFIHMQTFRAVPPRIWGNVNILRLHATGDDVTQVFNKVRNQRLTHVANCLVQEKAKTNKRFFANVDYDDNILFGEFNQKDMLDACNMYYFSSGAEQRRFKAHQAIRKINLETFIQQIAAEFTVKKAY